MNAHETAFARGHAIHVLFHPDYTVGPGIAPGLLTPSGWKAARGLVTCVTYRRWGIAPRPENYSEYKD